MELTIHSPLPCVFSGTFRGTLAIPPFPDSAVFVIPDEGDANLISAFGAFSCREGEYLFFRPDGGSTLTIDAQSVLIVLAPLPDPAHIPSAPGVYPAQEAREIFGRISRAAKCAGEIARLSLEAAVFDLFAMHLSLALPDSADAARIMPGVRLLERDYLSNDPVSRYADACGMHENRFRTVFMKLYGVSPVDHRNRLRLLYAQSLIKTLALPIGTAAAAAGFNSASYFCRLYKKVFGVNPSGGEDDGQMG